MPDFFCKKQQHMTIKYSLRDGKPKITTFAAP